MGLSGSEGMSIHHDSGNDIETILPDCQRVVERTVKVIPLMAGSDRTLPRAAELSVKLLHKFRDVGYSASPSKRGNYLKNENKF